MKLGERKSQNITNYGRVDTIIFSFIPKSYNEQINESIIQWNQIIY